MKKLSIKFISFVSILFVALLCLMSGTNISSYAVEQDLQTSNYLLTKDDSGADAVYESNLAAGATSGYGKFKLGEENVTLHTTANAGFKLVGWRINYVGLDSPLFVNVASLELTPHLDSDGNYNYYNDTLSYGESKSVDVSYRFYDANNDGDYEAGEFVISRVFEDLYLDPVFDFVYYNLKINSIFNLSTLQNYESETISLGTLYYQNKTNELPYKFENAVLFDNTNYIYIGDLYFDETNYYTLHNEAKTDVAKQQKIELSRGVYRLNDELNLTFNFNIVDDNLLSSNINLTGAVYNSNALALDENLSTPGTYFAVADSKYNRTASVNLRLSIEQTKLNQIDLVYDRLFVASLNIQLDNSVEGDNALALENITVENEWQKIDDTHYFVKSAGETDSAFRVSCNQQIVYKDGDKIYVYYNFDSLDYETNNAKSYVQIVSNFDINIHYTSKQYTVNFTFRIYSNDKFISLNTSFNILEEQYLTRNQTLPLNKTDVESQVKNIGYTFIGFATEQEKVIKDNLSVTIDKTKPQNLTIWLVYTINEYNIALTNVNTINLTNADSIYYPITEVGFNNQIYKIESTTNTINVSELSGAKVRINDNIIIRLTLNDGFKISYSLDEGSFIEYLGSISFKLTTDLIPEGDTINIAIKEDYILYSFTYYINKTLDTIKDENVRMADISAQVITGDVVSGDVVEEENSYKIVFNKNLKLYQTIKLSATGITESSSTVPYTYVFNRFTETDRISLAYSIENGNTYTHTAQITKDNTSIKVVFSMQDNFVNFSSNIHEAYDLVAENFQISVNSGETPKFETYEGGIRLIAKSGQAVTITLVEDSVNFGYKFIGYTFNSANTQTDELSFTITLPDSSQPNELELQFAEAEFLIEVMQLGGTAETDNQLVKFDGETTTKITKSNAEITFNMPLGYYVSLAVLGEDAENYSTQNNETISTNFNLFIDLSNSNIINIFKTYATNEGGNLKLTITVTYTLHTYSIVINYSVKNKKVMDNYNPNFNLIYNGTQTQSNSIVQFEGVSYGSDVKIEVSALPIGYTVLGFALNEDGTSSVGYTNTLDSVDIDNITENITLYYLAEYTPYTVNLSYDHEKGSPSLLINNNAANVATIYDNLILYAQPNSMKGYKLNSIHYFVPYTYSEETFADVYIYDNGFIKNTLAYDEGTTYYTKITLEEFSYTSFNPAEYAIIDGELTIFVNYGYIEMTIHHNGQLNKGGNITSYLLDNRLLDDYITYTAIRQNGEGDTLEDGEIVTNRDVLKLVITLNTIDIDQNPETTYDIYPLYKGLTLTSIRINNNTYTFKKVSDNVYECSQVIIADVLSSLYSEISIIYRFEYVNKSVTTTGNVTNESFYYAENNRKFLFQFTLNPTGSQDEYEVPENVYNANAQTHEYLSFGRFKCGFTELSNYNLYFEINSIIVTKNGQRLSESEYQQNGISYTISATKSSIDIDVRFVENLTVTIQVLPKIVVNADRMDDYGNYIFDRIYNCEVSGNTITGIAKTIGVGNDFDITVGTGDRFDIDMGDLLIQNISFNPQSSLKISGGHTDVGVYEVLISFNSTGSYIWLNEITIPFKIYLNISKLDLSIYANTNGLNIPNKVYNGKDDYNVSNLLQYLYIKGVTPNNATVFDIKLIEQRSILFNTSSKSVTATISSPFANEGALYDIVINGLNFATDSKNFNLTNNSVTIKNCIKILRKTLDITGIYAQDKLFDGTTSAIVDFSNIDLKGVENNDDISIDLTKLNFVYADEHIGYNKQVILKDANIFIGQENVLANYKLNIEDIVLYSSIYPDKLELEIQGLGKIKIENVVGRTDLSKVNLIPISKTGQVATLAVNVIKVDSYEYTQIYSRISRFLNRSVFAVGYELAFDLNGIRTKLSNELVLTLPKVDRIIGAFYLTGETSDRLSYSTSGDGIVINLAQMNADVSIIYLTQYRSLFTWWQILLIVVAAVILILTVVLIIVYIRHKKLKRYSLHERI